MLQKVDKIVSITEFILIINSNNKCKKCSNPRINYNHRK